VRRSSRQSMVSRWRIVWERRVGEENRDRQKTPALLEKLSACFRCAKGLIVHLLRIDGGLEELGLDVYER
jgi:hypothetical protein